MELHKVTLEKTDTCLTYALKRIGLKPDLCVYESINEHFHQIPWKARKKELTIGTILLWDTNLKWRWLPVSITKDGHIKNKLIHTGVHFAVYEGDGLISDCTRLHSPSPPSPSLRLRELSDMKSTPDWLLIYDTGE
jgi:hypothetical protein